MMPMIPFQPPQLDTPQIPSNRPQFPNWLPQLPMAQENENAVLRPLPELFKPRTPTGTQGVGFVQDMEGQVCNC